MRVSDKRILILTQRYGIIGVKEINVETGDILTDDGKRINVSDVKRFITNNGKYFTIKSCKNNVS